MQRLDGVDVAEARDHALVEERHLQRDAAPCARTRERRSIELW